MGTHGHAPKAPWRSPPPVRPRGRGTWGSGCCAHGAVWSPPRVSCGVSLHLAVASERAGLLPAVPCQLDRRAPGPGRPPPACGACPHTSQTEEHAHARTPGPHALADICRHRRGTPTPQAAGGVPSRLPSVTPVQRPRGSRRERLARWSRLFSRGARQRLGGRPRRPHGSSEVEGLPGGSGREQGDPSCPRASEAVGDPRLSGGHTRPSPCLLVGALSPCSWSLSQLSPIPPHSPFLPATWVGPPCPP